jgi:hypothetical protein
MALSFTASKDSVKRHFYSVYMRETGTAVASGDYDTLAHWTSFLALFQNIGSCENENVGWDEVPNTVDIDYGEKHPHSYDGTLDVKFIQNAVADFDAIEDMADENCDLLLVDDVNHIFHYFHNKRFKVERHITSGGIPYFNIQLHQISGEVSGSYGFCYLSNSIPTS